MIIGSTTRKEFALVTIDSKQKKMHIDISTEAGISLADLVLQTIFTFACESEEDKSNVENVRDMLNGGKDWVDVDLGVDND